MLCVMRRERRGVLHLDKYSPSKEICSVGGKRKEKKKKNERRKTTERKENQKFSD